jgi:large subunit ribosomal protein L29
MKPHKAKDIRELTNNELSVLLEEKRETLAKQRFQHALKQLHDTAYLKILKKDIARINTLITERQMSEVDE